MLTIPTIIEKVGGTEKYYNIFDKLYNDRIILLHHGVNDESATIVGSSLLQLDSINNSPITMFINSGGGSVYDGLSIYDLMNKVESPVSTICTGMAASMGAFLLSSGEKGQRKATKSARIMIHSVSSGAQGTYHDLKIDFEETKFLQNYLIEILAKNTDKSIAKLKKDMERDKWMSAEEALKYGIIDEII